MNFKNGDIVIYRNDKKHKCIVLEAEVTRSLLARYCLSFFENTNDDYKHILILKELSTNKICWGYKNKNMVISNSKLAKLLYC